MTYVFLMFVLFKLFLKLDSYFIYKNGLVYDAIL